MMLRYTPEAFEDLIAIKKYISENLFNPNSANKLIEAITKSCSNLKEFPNLGLELSIKTGRDTDLRYIITGKYFVFYRIDEKYISIIRVLDGRTNYMQQLFGSEK